MGMLPDITPDGRILKEGDDKGMEAVLGMLPMIKQVHVKRLVRNDGWTLRKALEHVGVMICERGEPKAVARKRKEPEVEHEDDGE